MKKNQTIQYLSLMILLILLCFVRCGDPVQECEPKAIDFIPLSIDPACKIMVGDSKLEDRFLVINSSSELEKAIDFDGETESGPCLEISRKLSEIDFNSSTLLIGKKAVQGIRPTLISQKVTRSCGNDVLIYSSIIRNGDYAALGVHLFAVIVPKFKGDVRFDIEISN